MSETTQASSSTDRGSAFRTNAPNRVGKSNITQIAERGAAVQRKLRAHHARHFEGRVDRELNKLLVARSGQTKAYNPPGVQLATREQLLAKAARNVDRRHQAQLLRVHHVSRAMQIRVVKQSRYEHSLNKQFRQAIDPAM